MWELISLANRHPRVNILQPGAGVGGHRIAVAPWFIVSSAPIEAKLMRTARDVNDAKPDWVLQKDKKAVLAALSVDTTRSMADIKVACMGLAFKPDIDDLSESPALQITEKFEEPGCQVLAVEPHIDALPASLADRRVTLGSIDEALAQADVICVLVRHSGIAGLSGKVPDTACLIDAAGL